MLSTSFILLMSFLCTYCVYSVFILCLHDKKINDVMNIISTAHLQKHQVGSGVSTYLGVTPELNIIMAKVYAVML